ncbi:MAG: RraA family protein [Actinobacteria bacterium]|nr:RraA family protein [Actinomycetota bacterium]
MRLEPPADELIELTPLNPFGRFPSGRPRVPDGLIERLRPATSEEVWAVLRRHGYNCQFEGGWFATQPGRVLVGRAVTAVFVPKRPDLHDLVAEAGTRDGRVGGQNSWVIDTLQPGDVMVVDMWGKVENGPFVGDNLANSLWAHTHAGAVIHGTIRDYQGIAQLTELQILCRGVHPSAIADATLWRINGPVRIGDATVLPGDIVHATPTGVTIVPPHLVQAVVEASEETRIRDRFGHRRLREGRYTPGQIDRSVWEPEIEADFQAWRLTERS